MPKIVIVGGKLQGAEAAYLARQANMEVALIDINPDATSQNLCDKFICGDVLSDNPAVLKALNEADIILPTMENDEVLKGLVERAERECLNLAFDWEAYQITSSKKKSDKLFADNGLPCPEYYPGGKYPYIAKPEAESGSHGVQIIRNEEEMKRFLAEGRDDYIIQEFVTGPSYSIEIIGVPGNYRTYEITEIFVDEVYDCNRATTLHTIAPEKKKVIEDYAMKIAEIIKLKGIMDLEVIDNNGDIRILEIDARLPSQTAIVVYHASGMNYIKELYDLFYHRDFTDEQINHMFCASLKHYLIDGPVIKSYGEHIMVEGSLLNYTDRICSEAVLISDFCPGRTVWRGTFIVWAEHLLELQEKEKLIIDELNKNLA